MTQKINEVAPPGWGHTKAEKEKTKPNKPKSKIGGSAHEFQKDLDSGKFKGLPGDKTYKDKKASMFKLMWSMKNKGDKPHYKPGVKNKLKAKYKEKNEMIDAKKIRNYKNVSNSTVEKANKEAEKVKDKEQKGTLQFPEMPTENLSLAPKGKGKKAAKALYKEDDIDEVIGAVAGGVARAGAVAGRAGAKVAKKVVKGVGHGIAAMKGEEVFVERILELDYKEFGFETQKDLIEYATKFYAEAADTWHPDPAKDRMSTSMKHTAKAVAHHDAQKKKPTVDSRAMASKLQDILKKQRERNAANKEEVEMKEGEWAKSKRIDRKVSAKLIKTHDEREKRYQAQQAAKKNAGAKKEEVEDAYDYKAKKGAVAAPGSGSIAKARTPKESDVNKSIEQQIKDAMKEKFDRDPTKATVSSKIHTTRTGAGAERKRVGAERKIKWGKGGAAGSKETKKRGRHDYEGDVDYVSAKTAPTLGKDKGIPTKKGRGLPKSRKEFSNSGEFKDTVWKEEESLIDAAMRELSKKN